MSTHLDVPRNLRRPTLSALIIHPAGSEAETIASQFGRLGADCTSVWPYPEALPGADIAVIFAQAETSDHIAGLLHGFEGAIVASIDPRDRGIVDNMMAAGVHAFLFRPLRVDTIMPQLALARLLRSQQANMQRKQMHVEDMLRTRRTVEKAVAIIGGALDLGSDDAYKHLRTLAMQRRQPIGALASTIIETGRLDQSRPGRGKP